MAGWRLRSALQADAPMLAAIELLTAPEFGRFVFEDLMPGWSAGALMSAVYSGDGPDGWRWCEMAESAEGRPLGAACAWPTRLLGKPDPNDPTAERLAHLACFREATPAHSLHVSRLGVLPGARRMGLGRALMESALEKGRRDGAPTASLFVWEDNAPARRLYDEMGFVVSERLIVAPHPRLTRDGASLLMTRAL